MDAVLVNDVQKKSPCGRRTTILLGLVGIAFMAGLAVGMKQGDEHFSHYSLLAQNPTEDEMQCMGRMIKSGGASLVTCTKEALNKWPEGECACVVDFYDVLEVAAKSCPSTKLAYPAWITKIVENCRAEEHSTPSPAPAKIEHCDDCQSSEQCDGFGNKMEDKLVPLRTERNGAVKLPKDQRGGQFQQYPDSTWFIRTGNVSTIFCCPNVHKCVDADIDTGSC